MPIHWQTTSSAVSKLRAEPSVFRASQQGKHSAGELLAGAATPAYLVVYTLGADGTASGPVVYPSSGATLFGFAFAGRDYLIVSEANGAPGASAASSYSLGGDGSLSLVKGSASTLQGAACWVVVTGNGRFAVSTGRRYSP